MDWWFGRWVEVGKWRRWLSGGDVRWEEVLADGKKDRQRGGKNGGWMKHSVERWRDCWKGVGRRVKPLSER